MDLTTIARCASLVREWRGELEYFAWGARFRFWGANKFSDFVPRVGTGNFKGTFVLSVVVDLFPRSPSGSLFERALHMDPTPHDTSHTVCPVKAVNPGAHDQWYVDEGKRCVRVTNAYLAVIRRSSAAYPSRLVRDALDKLPMEGPTRVRNAYKALAHVVMAALRQFAVDAQVPDELLFLARSKYWEFLCNREVDAERRKKLVVTFSECPEGDTVTNFAHQYNGTPCKHFGESLDVPEPASFRPSLKACSP